MSFTSSDLGNILEPGETAPTKLITPQIKDKNSKYLQPLKPELDPTKKVFRYRPGQAPKWADDEDEDEFQLAKERRGRQQRGAQPSVRAVEDRRLQRLEAASSDDLGSRSRRRREIQEAEIIESSDDEAVASEDLGSRRSRQAARVIAEPTIIEGDKEDKQVAEVARARSRRAATATEEQEMPIQAEEEGSEDEEDSSDDSDSSEDSSDDSDSSDVENVRRKMLRPVFRKKVGVFGLKRLLI